MSLFILIAIICLLLTFASEIIKLLHISSLFSARRPGGIIELQEDLKQARSNLERVRNTPSSGEYAQFVKTMRAEQRVKTIEEKILSVQKMGKLKGASIELIVTYIFKALIYVVLLAVSIRNRYTPVLVFGDHYNLQPLEGLLSFPTGVHNAISVPVWVVSCNLTFRLLSSFIPRK